MMFRRKKKQKKQTFDSLKISEGKVLQNIEITNR